MFLSTKAFFDDGNRVNIPLLERAETAIPAEFIRVYKRNVAPLTPIKTGRLRRSIITQQLGNTAEIAWRAPYAGAQNQGFHIDKTQHFVPAIGYGDRGTGFMAMPGTVHRYHNYTDDSTGPNFAGRAFQKTQNEMPAVLRALGLTK